MYSCSNKPTACTPYRPVITSSLLCWDIISVMPAYFTLPLLLTLSYFPSTVVLVVAAAAAAMVVN